MSFPKYPAYKESGVEWIGEIPVGWKIEKFRYVFFERKEKIETEDDISGNMLSVSGYRGIEIKKYDDENRRRLSDDLIGYRIVRKRQLVINTMWLNFSGLGVSWLDGYVSPAYRCYSINENDIDLNYANYILRSSIYVLGYTKYLQGIRPNSLQMSREDLMLFPIILPPLPEQQAIASFLDRECGKIDVLIAEQERLIALLAEKRQAVISHAVTKGLNPNASMKDSGIPWIGMVPEGWEVVTLKRKSSEITVGIVVEPSKYYVESGIPALRSLNIRSGYISDDNMIYISKEANELMRKSRLQEGDVVAVRTGQPGTSAAVTRKFEGANCIDLIIIRRSQNLCSNYLVWFLASDVAIRQFSEGSGGAIQQHFNVSAAKEMIVTVPVWDEQKKISNYLDQAIRNIDSLIEKARSVIILLKERRAALISAAVTGKIDVRAQSKALAA